MYCRQGSSGVSKAREPEKAHPSSGLVSNSEFFSLPWLPLHGKGDQSTLSFNLQLGREKRWSHMFPKGIFAEVSIMFLARISTQLANFSFFCQQLSDYLQMLIRDRYTQSFSFRIHSRSNNILLELLIMEILQTHECVKDSYY